MITEFLENHVRIADETESWESSIRLAADKLVHKKYIDSKYIEAMINNVKVNGPYVVIMPEVAMPHSRPEDGVRKTTLSLLKLNKPVYYPEDKPVRLVFVLAAKDSDKHLDLIAELSELLCDSKKVQELMASESVEAMMDILSMEQV